MTSKNMDQILEETAIQMLNRLAMTCRRRFLLSANLVEIRGPVIDGLCKFGSWESVDLGPLIRAWRCLCDRYRAELYDPQMSLFRDPKSQLMEDWDRFVYRELIPELVRDDSLVRNVLRALGGLPCKSPEKAADAVYRHFLAMTLPIEHPYGGSEEIIY